MKQKKIMLLVLIGLMPFLLAFRFGGEIRYGDPTRFQVNSDPKSGFKNIVVGDVDGDGDKDLIMIYTFEGSSTEAHNEVRLYLNQNAELGGPGPTALGGTPSGTVKDISTLFPSLLINDTANSYNTSYTIYQDGVKGTQTVDAKLGRDFPYYDIRSNFRGLAAAYKTVSGKPVIDYILVSRQYGNPTDNYYNGQSTNNPRQYAGRIVHLKNPYDGSDPTAPRGPWRRKDDVAKNHPGNANDFTDTTPDTEAVAGDPFPYVDNDPTTKMFFNDDYTFKASYGDVNYRVTFNAIELADLDGDGDYDLYSAPRQYHTTSGGGCCGDQVQYQNAQIWRYKNKYYDPTAPTGRNNFNDNYDDTSPNSNFLWSDGSTNGTYNQFSDFHLVDMNNDGIPDLLGLQGGGSWAPLSWIQGRNTGGFFNTNCKSAQLTPGGTMADIWAGKLRAPTSGATGDNNNGYPDLLCTRAAEPKIEVSMYSNTKATTPSTATYSEWQTIYTKPSDDHTTWMDNIMFGRVMTADVDNCGQNEIIVTISGRTAQYWIFKKQTTRYLTMMNLDELR